MPGSFDFDIPKRHTGHGVAPSSTENRQSVAAKLALCFVLQQVLRVLNSGRERIIMPQEHTAGAECHQAVRPESFIRSDPRLEQVHELLDGLDHPLPRHECEYIVATRIYQLSRQIPFDHPLCLLSKLGKSFAKAALCIDRKGQAMFGEFPSAHPVTH